MFKARVFVTLKSGVLDPQGKAVAQGLEGMGFAVGEVRVGKFLTVEVQAKDAQEAKAQVDAMCKKLLANPVIEEYQIELEAKA